MTAQRMTLKPSNPLPAQADVVIIGGGVAGVSAALYLAQQNVSVVLCEKGRIAGEQSSRNWGWIRKMGRDARELPLVIASTALWQQLADEMTEDIGFRVGGATYLAKTEADLAERVAWLEENRSFGLDSKVLNSRQTDEILGREDGCFQGALHTASDAMAEPAIAVPALARHAASLGAHVIENCAVRTVERSGGKISAVITEHGRIACQAVILAGGVWSRVFLENLGLSFPQLAIKSSVLRIGPTATPQVTGAVGSSRVSIRARQDGGYTLARSGAAEFQMIPAALRHFPAYVPILKKRWRIMKLRAGKDFFGPLGRARWQGDDITPFEKNRVLNPEPDKALLEDVLQSARQLFPKMGDAQPKETWAGMIDVMPDEIPVIDRVPNHEGMWMATGLSGHGFGIGPGVGLLAAQLITGETPVADPKPFAFSRFSQKVAA
ncbi:MAG: glycine/D-amino acid oxidase-like deaminating enzyme [Paracoccaceae bacterium]